MNEKNKKVKKTSRSSSSSKKSVQEKKQVKKSENTEQTEGVLQSHSDGSGPKSVSNFVKSENMLKNSSQESVKEHRRNSRRKGRKNKWFFRGVWLFVVACIGVAIASFCITCLNDMLAFNKPQNKVTIELSKNASTEEIANVLYENGLINNKWAFCTYSAFTKSDGQYEYGTFELTTDMDYQALINNLQASSNRVDTVSITFQEGLQVTQIGSKLEKAGVCTKEDFVAAVRDSSHFENYEFISEIKDKENLEYFLEGYLFPDTYEFYKDEDPYDVIEKFLNNTNNKLDKSIYNKAKKIGMSMDEVLTLASMIQKEAADKEDMYNVSSVFHNRLNSTDGYFNYLNSDPTMWYPYIKESKVPEGYDSLYNTYTHPGLPVGPICNPGLSAIEAALNPNETNYYYFCHDADGKPYYAETEYEHQNNLVTAGLA